MAGAAQGTAISVAMDMTEGIIARFRTMAIARVSVLTGHVIGSVIQTMLAIAIVMVVAVLIGFRSTTGPVEWVAATGLLVLAALAVSWLSVALGMVGRERGDREQPADVPGVPAVPEQRLRADRVDAGRPRAGSPSTSRSRPLIETVRGLLLGTPDRRQRRARRRLVRRDLGRRLRLGATALRPRTAG